LVGGVVLKKGIYLAALGIIVISFLSFTKSNASFSECSLLEKGEFPTKPHVVLKMRAAEIFAKEKEKPQAPKAYLASLSFAVQFSNYTKLEELVLKYECGKVF